MDFTLSEEQRALQRVVREFVGSECPPDRVLELDDEERFPRYVWQKLGEAGLLTGPVPAKYGGSEISLVDECLVIEELSRPMLALGMAYQLSSFAGPRAIGSAGSEVQKERFLPALARGELMFGFAMTEPAGGTDILSVMSTRAVPVSGGWQVTGHKTYITNADQADYLLTVVRTGSTDGRKSDGLTLFLVPTRARGLTIRRMRKLGGRAISACDVYFDDVHVPDDDVLGQPGRAWRWLVGTLNTERITVAAECLGMASAAIADAKSYALQREAFGRPIGAFQAVQHKIADSIVDYEAARLLTLRAAALEDAGLPCRIEAASAKMFASEAAFRIATRGMDILAGAGFLMETHMQRYFRDSRQLVLGPVTNEMVRNQIAEASGMPRSY